MSQQIVRRIVQCPAHGSTHTPTKMWCSRLPSGQPIWYGQLPEHDHSGTPCEWSHLVVQARDANDVPGVVCFANTWAQAPSAQDPSTNSPEVEKEPQQVPGCPLKSQFK
jgi:hypothetical protein